MGSFRLEPRRPASDELRRALAEQMELAQALLSAGRAWPPERRAASVHGFRKAAKRIRAALDLAKDAGDRHATTLVKHGFREAARALSRARDRDALGAILVRASRALPRRKRASVLAKWKALLLPAPAASAAGRTDRVFEEIVSRVRALRRTWDEVRLPRFTPTALALAIERSWDRARDRFRGPWKSRDPEWLHETRKRCQRLQHQLLLVEALRPKALGEARRGLAEVSEALGLARDTGLLLARTHGVIAPEDADIDFLRRTLSREHRENLRAAHRVGRRVLRAKGSEVRRQIERAAAEYASRSVSSRAKVVPVKAARSSTK